MTRFVEGDDRTQSTLFPEPLIDYWARTIRRSMSLSMSLIWPGLALKASSQRREEGRLTIRRHC